MKEEQKGGDVCGGCLSFIRGLAADLSRESLWLQHNRLFAHIGTG